MFANRGFLWIGSMRCLWGIMALGLPAMLVGFAVGLEFGKAYSHPPRPDALGGDRLARVEEAAGKLIEGPPAPYRRGESAHDARLRVRAPSTRADLPLAGAIARLAAGGTADAFARFFPGSARDGPSIQHHQPGPAPGAQRFQRRGGIRAARVSSRTPAPAAVLLVVGIAVSLLYNWLILWKAPPPPEARCHCPSRVVGTERWGCDGLLQRSLSRMRRQREAERGVLPPLRNLGTAGEHRLPGLWRRGQGE